MIIIDSSLFRIMTVDRIRKKPKATRSIRITPDSSMYIFKTIITTNPAAAAAAPTATATVMNYHH